MLGGTVLDRVSSINDLGVIMEEKMNFSEHIDVVVGKAIAMLGFIRRLSFEFRNPYILILSTRPWFIRSWSTPAVTCVWTWLNVCREGLSDMHCVVWVGRIFMIYHRTSIDVLFCA
jgi:hypothetical protein